MGTLFVLIIAISFIIFLLSRNKAAKNKSFTENENTCEVPETQDIFIPTEQYVEQEKKVRKPRRGSVALNFSGNTLYITKPDLQNMKDTFSYWFGKKKTDVVVFDTETNGFSDDSEVLSLSAIRYKWQGNLLKEADRYNRFYFPSSEHYSKSAMRVNGLSEKVILKKELAVLIRNFTARMTIFKKFFAKV